MQVVNKDVSHLKRAYICNCVCVWWWLLDMPILKNTDLAIEVLICQVTYVTTDGPVHGDTVLDKMLKEVGTMLKENGDVFRAIVDDPVPRCAHCVLVEMLEDGKINWGRIVAMFALLYTYSQKFRGRYKCLKALRAIFVKFFLKEVTPWIRSVGGMYNFVYPCKHTILYLTGCVLAIVMFYDVFIRK